MNPSSSIGTGRPGGSGSLNNAGSSAGQDSASSAHNRREPIRQDDRNARNLSEARSRRGLEEPRFELPDEEPAQEEPRPEAVTVPLPPEHDPLSQPGPATMSQRATQVARADSATEGEEAALDGEAKATGQSAQSTSDSAETTLKRPHLATGPSAEVAADEVAVDANGVALDVPNSTDEAAPTPFEAARQRALLLATQAQAAPVAQSALAAAFSELNIQPAEDGEAGLSTLEAEALGTEKPEGDLALDGLDLRPTERVFGPTSSNSLALNLPQSQVSLGVATEVANAVSRLMIDARDDAQGVLRFRTESGQTFFAQTRIDPTGQHQVELRLMSDDPNVRALLLERLSDLRSALSRVGFADAQVSVERDFSGHDPRREPEPTEEPLEPIQTSRRRSPFTQNAEGPAAPGRLHLIL